jgi:hypothetical protein
VVGAGDGSRAESRANCALSLIRPAGIDLRGIEGRAALDIRKPPCLRTLSFSGGSATSSVLLSKPTIPPAIPLGAHTRSLGVIFEGRLGTDGGKYTGAARARLSRDLDIAVLNWNLTVWVPHHGEQGCMCTNPVTKKFFAVAFPLPLTTYRLEQMNQFQ